MTIFSILPLKNLNAGLFYGILALWAVNGLSFIYWVMDYYFTVTLQRALEEGVRDSGFKPLNGSEIQDSRFKFQTGQDQVFKLHMSHTCVHLRVRYYHRLLVGI